MKLQNLTVIFIIIILPITLVLSAYIGYEIKTINKQNMYNTGLISATHDAIFSFEINTKKDDYSNNAEKKRENIKAAVKTFENSLSTTCNLGLYNNEEIEEYIPAIVFGLYDGFYMYAPSELTTTDSGGNTKTEYKHNLRNYVYYSEEIKDDTNNVDLVVRYSLDNYVAVTGTIDGINVTKSGYLTKWNDIKYVSDTEYEYKGVSIDDDDAMNYYKDSWDFTWWFLHDAKLGKINKDLDVSQEKNDPEDENSLFVQHKRKIMKEKIETILNSSITAYAKKTGNKYKMPKFSEEDWEKIYTNISVISFVQGMNLGFKNYNNYCILNSTNNQEYVNPNLMYFIYDGEYHDIRCTKIKDKESTGYKIGDFEKLTRDVTDSSTGETTSEYYYKHTETACYECINGSVNTNMSVYDYVRAEGTNNNVKKSYFVALARERYNTTKLSDNLNKVSKTPEQAMQGWYGTKSGDEVKQILYEIYNKYTYYHDSDKSIYVSLNGSNHAVLYISFPYMENYIKSIDQNKYYSITGNIEKHILKINEN